MPWLMILKNNLRISMKLKKKAIWNVLSGVLWVLIAGACVFLFVSASVKKGESVCAGLEIHIEGSGSNFFIDKKDIETLIKAHANGSPEGKPLSSFDLRKLERDFAKDKWIKNANVYFDNRNILQVKVEEREPVARVFTTSGSSFYLDSLLEVLPSTTKFSARVPVFTGFTGMEKALKPTDSALLQSAKLLSNKILQDEFLMAMIDQIDIRNNQNFVFIPKIGDQAIVFGDSSQADEKFRKLKLFYKNIMVKSGWDRYSEINLTYANQVVAKIKGQEDITADSLRAIEILDILAKRASDLSADSTVASLNINGEKASADNSMVLGSIERDDEPADSDNTDAISIPVAPKPVAVALAPKPAPAVKNQQAAIKPKTDVAAPKPKPAVPKPTAPAPRPAVKKPEVKKPEQKKPAAATPKPTPKVLMPKQNNSD